MSLLLDPHFTRTRVHQTGKTLDIAYPPKPEIYGRIFMIVWLVIWAAGEIGVIWALSAGQELFVSFFLFIWLAFWSVGGFVAFTYLIWNIAGIERMVISPEQGTLTITRSMPFWHKSKTCDLSEVCNLRVEADWEQRGDDDERDNHGLLCAPIAGSLKFDCGVHTLGFGLEMPHGEAEILLGVIGRALPHLLVPKP